MDRKSWAVIIFIIVVLIAVGIFIFARAGGRLPGFLGRITSLIEGSPTPVPTIPEVYGNFFETEYLHLTVPTGWKISTTNTGDVPTGFAKEYYELEKDGYLLHINPSTGPTGGPEGGRFSDIAQHIPSSDLIIKIQPSTPCEENNPRTTITTYLYREDFYVSKDNTSDWCNKPDKTVWYGSYISSPDTGYFGEVHMDNKKPETRRYLIVMGYTNTDSINDLPQKGNKELDAMLLEMSGIVRSIVFK